MPQREPTRPEPNLAWHQFSGQYPGDPRLELPYLYALPSRLIDKLVEFARPVLADGHEQFERDLRAASCTGFANGHPIYAWYADRDRIADEAFRAGALSADTVRESVMTSARTGQDLFPARWRENPQGVTTWREAIQALDHGMLHRSKGFIGWLATNSTFWSDVAAEIRRASSSIHATGSINSLGQLAAHVRIRRQSPEHLSAYWDLAGLIHQWCILDMLTPDLPIPYPPVLIRGDAVPSNRDPQGVHLFLPVSLLADQKVKLQDLVQDYLSRNPVNHLQPWIDGEPKWGYQRYAKVFDLYLYLELALRVRYPDRLKNNADRVDRAFAAFWEEDDVPSTGLDRRMSGVKQIRRKLDGRLQQCRNSMSEFLDPQ